ELVVWDVPWHDTLFRPVLPDDAGLLHHRAVIREAGAALRRPISDPPVVETEAMAEVWRREHANEAMAFTGDAGEVREVECLEALMFARQNARYDQLESPTEFLVAVLRKSTPEGTRLRIYSGASDTMFPPKSVYPLDAAKKDVNNGWVFWRMLHNHTIQTYQGQVALGVPAPSTNDVHLSRNLVDSLGLLS